eukprot:Colp12_sorted_trinity150504_noHs@36410
MKSRSPWRTKFMTTLPRPTSCSRIRRVWSRPTSSTFPRRMRPQQEAALPLLLSDLSPLDLALATASVGLRSSTKIVPWSQIHPKSSLRSRAVSLRLQLLLPLRLCLLLLVVLPQERSTRDGTRLTQLLLRHSLISSRKRLVLWRRHSLTLSRGKHQPSLPASRWVRRRVRKVWTAFIHPRHQPLLFRNRRSLSTRKTCRKKPRRSQTTVGTTLLRVARHLTAVAGRLPKDGLAVLHSMVNKARPLEVCSISLRLPLVVAASSRVTIGSSRDPFVSPLTCKRQVQRNLTRSLMKSSELLQRTASPTHKTNLSCSCAPRRRCSGKWKSASCHGSR